MCDERTDTHTHTTNDNESVHHIEHFKVTSTKKTENKTFVSHASILRAAKKKKKQKPTFLVNDENDVFLFHMWFPFFVCTCSLEKFKYVLWLRYSKKRNKKNNANVFRLHFWRKKAVLNDKLKWVDKIPEKKPHTHIFTVCYTYAHLTRFAWICMLIFLTTQVQSREQLNVSSNGNNT